MKPTKTTNFLMPLTGYRIEDFKGYNFKNCYLGDNYYIYETNYCIYVVIRPVLEKKLFDFVNNILSSPNIVDIYSSKGYTVFVFEVPDKYKHIIDLFWEGAYSKFDKEYVEDYFPKKIDVINKSGGIQRKVSQVRKVFDQHKDLRKYWYDKAGIELQEDDEHWSIPLEEEETFRESL